MNIIVCHSSFWYKSKDELVGFRNYNLSEFTLQIHDPLVVLLIHSLKNQNYQSAFRLTRFSTKKSPTVCAFMRWSTQQLSPILPEAMT